MHAYHTYIWHLPPPPKLVTKSRSNKRHKHWKNRGRGVPCIYIYIYIDDIYIYRNIYIYYLSGMPTHMQLTCSLPSVLVPVRLPVPGSTPEALGTSVNHSPWQTRKKLNLTVYPNQDLSSRAVREMSRSGTVPHPSSGWVLIVAESPLPGNSKHVVEATPLKVSLLSERPAVRIIPHP